MKVKAAVRMWLGALLCAAALPLGAGFPVQAAPVDLPNPPAVKAINAANAEIVDPQWFVDRKREGFELYIADTLESGTTKPAAGVLTSFKNALAAGMKIGAYTRNIRHWEPGLLAAGPYTNQLQLFALDVESDPGYPVTRAYVDGVKSHGVRPVIYAGFGEMWPQIQGSTAIDFSDVPLWDTDPRNIDLATWTPSLLFPPPVQFGGWNTPTTLRIGVQQKLHINFAGVHDCDVSSFDRNWLQ